MKQKTFFKKGLALVLTVMLIIAAVPTVGLLASAENPACPQLGSNTNLISGVTAGADFASEFSGSKTLTFTSAKMAGLTGLTAGVDGTTTYFRTKYTVNGTGYSSEKNLQILLGNYNKSASSQAKGGVQPVYYRVRIEGGTWTGLVDGYGDAIGAYTGSVGGYVQDANLSNAKEVTLTFAYKQDDSIETISVWATYGGADHFVATYDMADVPEFTFKGDVGFGACNFPAEGSVVFSDFAYWQTVDKVIYKDAVLLNRTSLTEDVTPILYNNAPVELPAVPEGNTLELANYDFSKSTDFMVEADFLYVKDNRSKDGITIGAVLGTYEDESGVRQRVIWKWDAYKSSKNVQIVNDANEVIVGSVTTYKNATNTFNIKITANGGKITLVLNDGKADVNLLTDLDLSSLKNYRQSFGFFVGAQNSNNSNVLKIGMDKIRVYGTNIAYAAPKKNSEGTIFASGFDAATGTMEVTVKSASSTTLKEGTLKMTDSKGTHAFTEKVRAEGQFTVLKGAYVVGEQMTFAAEFDNGLPQNDAALQEGGRLSTPNSTVAYLGAPLVYTGGRHCFEIKNYDFSKSTMTSLDTTISYKAESGTAADNSIWVGQLIGKYDIEGHGTQYAILMYRVGSQHLYFINDDGTAIADLGARTVDFSATKFDFSVVVVDGKYTWTVNGDEIISEKDLGVDKLKNFEPCYGAFMYTTNPAVELSLDKLTIGGDGIGYTKSHFNVEDYENLALKSRLVKNYNPDVPSESAYMIPTENPEVMASNLGVDILEASGTVGYSFDTFDIDLSDGKTYVYGADFKVYTNTRTESSFGFLPVKADGYSQFGGVMAWRSNDPYRICAVANGGGSPWGPIQKYSLWQVYGKYNDFAAPQPGMTVLEATDAGVTVNMKVAVSEKQIDVYINDTLSSSYPIITDKADGTVTPMMTFFFRNITRAEISNFFAAGDALTIKKNVVQAPAAPVVESKTDSSVTLVANPLYEYSKDRQNWQESNTFVGLLGGHEYTFYQRIKATPDAYESIASAPTLATTETSVNLAPESRLTRSGNPYRIGTDVVLTDLGEEGKKIEHRSSEVGRASYSYDTYTVDLSDGKTFTMGADFTVYTNSWTESSFGFMPMIADGYSELNQKVEWRANIPYRLCMVANGQMNGDKWGASQNYTTWLCYGEYNNLYQSSVGKTVTANDTGVTVNLLCSVSENQIDYYVDGVLTLSVPVKNELSGKIEPHLSYFAKSCNVDISNFFLSGNALASSKITTEEDQAVKSRAVKTDGLYKHGNKVLSTKLTTDKIEFSGGYSGIYMDTFKIDTSNGKYYVYGADFYIADNNRTESSFGFVPVLADGYSQMNGVHNWMPNQPYRIGAVANGEMHYDVDPAGKWGPTKTYSVWEIMGDYNDFHGSQGAPVMTVGPDGYQKVNMKVKVFADKVELYINDYLNETYEIYTDMAEGGGTVTNDMVIFFRNCIGYITNITAWGPALTYVEPPAIPTIPAMTTNFAPYMQVKQGTAPYTNYFDCQLPNMGGGHYFFGGVKETSANPYLVYRSNVTIHSRSKKADGNTAEWTGTRFSIMDAGGATYYFYMMQGSCALISESAGWSVGNNTPIKIDQTYDVCFQYFPKTNRVNVWIDNELLFNNYELPRTDAKDRVTNFGCWFEGCSASLTNIKFYGSGYALDISDEMLALYNNPLFNTNKVPAIPDGNINYFQNVNAVDSSGDISFKMNGNKMFNLFTDESGTIRFVDAAGRRNINNIKNSSTFVFQFDYTINDIAVDQPGKAALDKGGVMMIRRMTPPVNSANYGLGFYMTEKEVGFRRYSGGSVAQVFSANFKYEVGRTYKISIVSGPTWSKLFVDGKQMVVASGLPEYPFTLQYMPLNSAATLENFVLYDAVANEDREVAEKDDREAAMTGKTVLSMDNTDLSANSNKYLVAVIIALGVAALCAAALVFVILRNKKKKSQQPDA